MPTKTRPNEVPGQAMTTLPRDPTPEELATAQAGAGTPVMESPLDKPTFAPPGTAAAAAATAATGWLSNKHVLMIWQTIQPLDAWIFLDGGTGWKHLTQTNDVATRGMGVLGAAARAGGGIVQAYEGAGGAIDGFYLW